MACQGTMVAADEKRRRSAHRMRISMGFGLKLSILHSQEDFDEYLRRHHGPFLFGIKVEWCHPGTTYKISLPNGVYFHPQILALGVQLSLTDFVQHVLISAMLPLLS